MSNEIAMQPTPQATAGRPDTPEVRRHVVWYNALFLTLTPIAALVAVPWYALTVGVTWVEVAACAAVWVAVGLSVTAGYHRLFTHRAYEASAPVRALFAVLEAAALENSGIAWAAAHRVHHRVVDSTDHPYNPQEGFWYSHMGGSSSKGPSTTTPPTCPTCGRTPSAAGSTATTWRSPSP